MTTEAKAITLYFRKGTSDKVYRIELAGVRRRLESQLFL